MTRTVPFRWLSVGLALCGVAGGCRSEPAGGAPGARHLEAEIQALAFAELPVLHAGDTVRWTNRDVVPHRVTVGEMEDGAPDSGMLRTGDDWSWVVPDDLSGEIALHCLFHPTMTTRLRIEP